MALLLLSSSSSWRNTPRTRGRQMWQTLASSVRYRGYMEQSLSWGPVKIHLPPPFSPVGPSRCFALCLPIKSTLYLQEQHVEGVAHQKQPPSIHSRTEASPVPGLALWSSLHRKYFPTSVIHDLQKRNDLKEQSALFAMQCSTISVPAPLGTHKHGQNREMQKAKLIYAIMIILQLAGGGYHILDKSHRGYLWGIMCNNPYILLFLIFSWHFVRLNKDTHIFRILPRVHLSLDERILTSNWLQMG